MVHCSNAKDPKSLIFVGGFFPKLCGSLMLMLALMPKFAKTSLSVMLVSTDLHCGYTCINLNRLKTKYNN